MSSEPLASGPLEERVFDHDRALAMLADDVDLLAEVIAVFLETVPELLRELEAALSARDYREVERLAHGVKGAALNVHALRIRQRAAEVEASAQTKDGKSIIAQFHELRDEMARFRSYLDAFDWQVLRGPRGQ